MQHKTWDDDRIWLGAGKSQLLQEQTARQLLRQAAQRRTLGYVMNNELGRISKRLRLNQSTIWNFLGQSKKTTRNVIQRSQRTYPEPFRYNCTASPPQ